MTFLMGPSSKPSAGTRIFRAFVLALALAFCHPQRAALAGSEKHFPGKDASIAIDIPAQSLEDAIYAFGEATGTEVTVDGRAVQGLRSAEVKGTYTAAEALRILLTDTGLDVRRVGERAVVLAPSRPDPLKSALYRAYSAALQKAVLRVLCSASGTPLGTYRIATRLWLTDRGEVSRVDMLSSTGDKARDYRIEGLLVGISAGKAPPQLPQPIVMMILPRPRLESGDCEVR